MTVLKEATLYNIPHYRTSTRYRYNIDHYSEKISLFFRVNQIKLKFYYYIYNNRLVYYYIKPVHGSITGLSQPHGLRPLEDLGGGRFLLRFQIRWTTFQIQILSNKNEFTLNQHIDEKFTLIYRQYMGNFLITFMEYLVTIKIEAIN